MKGVGTIVTKQRQRNKKEKKEAINNVVIGLWLLQTGRTMNGENGEDL
jgi:hypothetical protein